MTHNKAQWAEILSNRIKRGGVPIREQYDHYVKWLLSCKNRPILPYHVYLDCIETRFKWMVDELHLGRKVEFPWGCGFVMVVKYKINNFNRNSMMSIDFGATRKAGKIIRYDKTDKPFRYRIFHCRAACACNVQKYDFVPVRIVKRTLGKLISGGKDYILSPFYKSGEWNEWLEQKR